MTPAVGLPRKGANRRLEFQLCARLDGPREFVLVLFTARERVRP